MVKFFQLLICFLSVLWLSACATMGTANAPDELALTLAKAIVAIPAEYYKWDVPSDLSTRGRMKDVAQDLTNIAGDNKIPLVIYMHGCNGFSSQSTSDISFLIDNGYAVLAPSSFARKYKPISCNPYKYEGGLHSGAIDFRLAEANYAHQAAKNLPWVDKHNIFMMGFSEGGHTTAQYQQGGLAGRIILGWTCYTGISGPEDEPILAVVASNDPWFRRLPSVHCGHRIFFRQNVESIVVNDSIHDVQSISQIKEKILKFLELNRRP